MRLVIVPFFVITTCSLYAQDEIDNLVSRLRSGADLQAVLSSVQKNDLHDPRISQALADLFDRTTDQLVRSRLAVLLIQRKDPNPRYFAELEKPLLSILAVDPPDYASEPEEFFGWCASLKIASQDCFDKYVIYPAKPLAAAFVSHDQRFVPLFQRCLAIKMAAVWRQCAGGLALLGDKGSIPAVTRKIATSKDLSTIMILTLFDDPLADQIALDLAKPDKMTLDSVRQQFAWRADQKKLKDAKPR